MRQAFLIIAHGDFLLLQRLILALECPKVDFYVHIDAKVKFLPDLYVKGQSSLTVLNNRIDTRWGDFSQIATEMVLLEKAYHKGTYSHYHIISGTHFPIKPIDEIIAYYDTMTGKTIFSGLCQSTFYQESLKLRQYNMFTRRLAYGSPRSRILFQKIWRVSHDIQNLLKIRRNKNTSFYKACNWASFSEAAVEFLLQEKKQIKKIFGWSFCGDEYFAPTLLKESTLSEHMVSNDKILKQEMGDANTRVFTLDDFCNIMSSGCLFARKFSDSHLDVVERISEIIIK